MPFRTPTTIVPQRRPREAGRSKVYSVPEYLMMLQEVEPVRLIRPARKAHHHHHHHQQQQQPQEVEEEEEEEE